jgi:hypothetical protein
MAYAVLSPKDLFATIATDGISNLVELATLFAGSRRLSEQTKRDATAFMQWVYNQLPPEVQADITVDPMMLGIHVYHHVLNRRLLCDPKGYRTAYNHVLDLEYQLNQMQEHQIRSAFVEQRNGLMVTVTDAVVLVKTTKLNFYKRELIKYYAEAYNATS